MMLHGYDSPEAICGELIVENRKLKAEVTRLKEENKSIKYCYEQAKSYNDTLAESCEKNCKKFNMTTRAEAIKEFAERLKNQFEISSAYSFAYIECQIDNLVKEMEESE